jgi:phosphoesterase RecJ-like protein
MYKKIVEIINKYENICIFTHISMDGDTLGSALALAFALEKLGIVSCVINEEHIPRSLEILPGRKFIREVSEIGSDFSTRGKLAIAVDMADPKMLGKRAGIFERFDYKINVDHHLTNKSYCDINLIEPDFAATAEIVYFLIKELGAGIDKSIAECLYTGICTDTGGFKFKNTSSQSHLIASELLKYQLDIVQMQFSFFEANPYSKIKIMGYVASELKFYFNGMVAFARIPLEVFKIYGATDEDTDGLVNIGRSVIGVEISILAREIRKDHFKVNFRSIGRADVSVIASKFDGGGHKAAAGCSIACSADKVEELLIHSVKDTISAINGD